MDYYSNSSSSCADVSPSDGAAAAASAATCDPDGLSIYDLFACAAAAVSSLGIAAILLMQMDGVSRRLLSPSRLLAKRRREYRYALSQGTEYNSLMMRQYVGGGEGAYDPRSESRSWESYAANDASGMELLISEILDDATAAAAAPVIVALEQDLTDDDDPDTYHLFLAFPPPSTPPIGGGLAKRRPYRRVRVPLLAFCELLASAFEGHLTSTTLCFVADASSGLGIEILTTLVKRCDLGVATIINPAWMTSLSLLMSKGVRGTVSAKQYERVVFALCRLDAWRVRDSVGTSRTVLFALPGQSCVPVLLPLIQRVFVHDRHVFVYDGCCHSVELGIALRARYGFTHRRRATDGEIWEEVSASPNVVTANYSMAPLRHIRELPETLARIDGIHASTVEAWMASVDTFLDMKSKEKTNFYAPFVCQMGFLMKRSTFGNGSRGDLSELALKNVLQYITGSKSRPLPSDVVSAAISCLEEMRCKFLDEVKASTLSNDERTLIEKCVFAHKAILLGDKTLLDTVQPKEDWSLKAAKKLKSCLCCIPGEGDEDDEGDDGESSKPKDGTDSLVGLPTSNMGRSKYVDGKSGFAFDPTLFSK
ncbi:hypothetical protein ACHAXA_005143 [Cyclostephanos tholiformis]|uniref:Uncharacterized protein n=1 Tax=Cyclostephanos tholiformis TaxID=382380 RepID=A0ABD3RXE9_9STRA